MIKNKNAKFTDFYKFVVCKVMIFLVLILWLIKLDYKILIYCMGCSLFWYMNTKIFNVKNGLYLHDIQYNT